MSPGVLGELVVTGDGLARGYMDAALDKNRFIEVVIDGQSTRAYRTGDRARFRPIDFQIEFLVVLTSKSKFAATVSNRLRWNMAILSHHTVRDAAVVVRRTQGQEPEMVGFIAAHDAKLTEDDTRGQVEVWKNFFGENSYADIDNISSSIGNDFVGWTSMYDGSQIDKAEMQEWLSDTIGTILEGQDVGRVLEIELAQA